MLPYRVLQAKDAIESDFLPFGNPKSESASAQFGINRYISWPGQALAYKLGELKIRELRNMATKELGPKFDLAAFHDAVLGQGSVPLDVLEQQINDWVAAEKAKS